jgi:hypothetical protein
MKSNPPLPNWPCDWDSHEMAQLRRGHERSFRQNLEWLEAMTNFSKKLQANSQIKESSPAYGEGFAKSGTRKEPTPPKNASGSA